MKKYVKIYMDYFGYDTSDYIPCEIPGCLRIAVDINHIDARGMGGNPSKDKDKIENLMAMCRTHHVEYGDIASVKERLKNIHKSFMEGKK